MWTLRGQFNRPNAEGDTAELEWSAVMVDTEEEAETWWNTRTAQSHRGRVSTMFNPEGQVMRVKFD